MHDMRGDAIPFVDVKVIEDELAVEPPPS